MLLRSRGLVVVFCVLFAVAGAWLMGCGAGNVSSLLFTSGLLLPGAGPPDLPDPDPGPGDGDGDGDGGDGGGGDNVCVVWRNDADLDARVMLWASTSGTISFEDLQTFGNLESIPADDQGCIDQADIQGDRIIRPLIPDGAQLSYQLTCENSASLLFGVGDESVVVSDPDDTFGVLRQGVDFDCGDTLNLTITDDDQDGDPEIGT
ncbi:MAG: hypothetical protein JSU68_15200 [Phycisphaerales bacterium]|nr:MAG: hypothetical protein JSU68_15200 [Phycisphaerales bacterium]